MTRKHFVDMAHALRRTNPRVLREEGALPDWDLGSDEYAAVTRQWERTALQIADACAAANGRFDRDRFLCAAGYHVRPDGSLFPEVTR